jgi:aldehyde:ferredoxin oxidoreductase
MSLMKGCFNRLLKIDLTTRSFHHENLPDELMEKSLGGKGLGIRLLMAENPAGVDAFSPENSFVIAVGPVTGTAMWGQSRFAVFTKSPATNGFGESYCGGTLASKIKGCGVDAVIIRGKADSLTYLVIDKDAVRFEDAASLKGAETFETEKYILDHSPKGAGAMVIGPAGENLVRFACIKSDKWRSLGRGGMGAVLGAKNIKGISFSGKERCPIADEEMLRQVAEQVAQTGKESPVSAVYQQLGTPMQVKVTNSQRCFPTRYWQSGYFEKWENLSADYMQKHFHTRSIGCPPCFLKCTKRSILKNGRHAGLELEGPEYETIYALGGLNELDSLEEVAWLNDLCDRLGIDTMSAGNVSAFAVEAYKAGKIGFEIDYNQPDKMAELFGLISRKEGIGALLGEGVRVASEELGLNHIAVHVKGLEPGGFEPRVLKGMGLSYAIAARGACHLRSTFYKAELSGQMDKDQIAGKAELLVDYEDRATIFDCLILCRFFRDFILWDKLQMLVEATTGMKFTLDELRGLANEITQSTRNFNAREGLDSSQDQLPRAFFQRNCEGALISEDELKTMIDEYNHIRKSRTKDGGTSS